MADVSLNGLKVKTDSLPDNWYVTLVNPINGEPGENMTVARFVELFGSLLYKSQSLPPDGNVFIVYHNKSNNNQLMVEPSRWVGYQNNGEIADGVAVVEGGKILVIAPTEAAIAGLKWSSTAVIGGGTTTNNRSTAINDWNGKSNTAEQITHTECSGASYAPGYCAQYSRVNTNGQGITAGMWWLPSLGEMMMIYANKRKINYALSLIKGAAQITESGYWTSTEYGDAYAWYLSLVDGYAYTITKYTNELRVRPVSFL